MSRHCDAPVKAPPTPVQDSAMLHSAAEYSISQASSTTPGPVDIVMMDAVSLKDTIHSRRVSCVEVMNAYLDHAEKLNPKVNAIVALQDRSGLLAQARERDAQLARGESMGPLHGFPHAIKDLQPVRGIRSTWGSPILKDFVPSADSLMVERIRNAGAIIIGKTNTPEFGLGLHTYNPVYGATRNAYDQSRSAGGSSGGAAVALALRMMPVADGSDYGGSLRNPAGWNNVFGFRPSFGRIPADARDVWLPSMSVLGPMARTVTDLAMLLSVLAGFDPRVPLAIEDDGMIFQQRLEWNFKGTRVAWVGDFKGHTPYEPEAISVCKNALRVFESIGCVVEEAVPDYPLESVWNAALRLRSWQLGGALLAYYNDPSTRAKLKPEAILEIEMGLKLSAYEVTAASIVRTEFHQAVRRFFDQYDYFIAPSAQLFPFDGALCWPQEIAGNKMTTYSESMKATLLITMSGCPALAVPAGFGHQGLPIGIQIVAPNHHEFACLQLAYAYELATNWTSTHLPSLIGPPARPAPVRSC